MPQRGGQFTAKDGLTIFHQVWSPEERPKAILLIIHGLGEHSGRYQNYVDYFAPRGYAIYALDLRGHGRSGGKRGHVNRFDDYLNDVRQLHDLARAAEPDRKIFMLGHSLGSLIALTYALRTPDDLSGVISSGTAMRDALNIPGWLRALAAVLNKIVPALTLNNGVDSGCLSRDPSIAESYDSDPLVHHVGSVRLAAEVEIVRKYLLDHAGEWKLPLLSLHGEEDKICLPQGAQQLYGQMDASQVTVRQYTGAYHEVHNDVSKEAVFQDVEEWLQQKQ